MSKVGMRLADENYNFDLKLAKKTGEVKSLPALYPLEKISKFSNLNLILIPLHSSVILRPTRSVLNSDSSLKNFE